MIGEITIFQDGGWVGSGRLQSDESAAELREALRRAAPVYTEVTDRGNDVLGRVLIEVTGGDVWSYEVLDVEALRCLERLITFLEATP
jgi:hypothetical protein